MKIIKAVGIKPPTVTGTLERLLTAQDQKRRMPAGRQSENEITPS